MSSRTRTAAKRGALSMDLANGDEFVAAIRRAVDGMEIVGRRQLLQAGIIMQNTARELCPVDTGRLRSSITMKQGEGVNGPYVEVGTNVAYAAWVEYGTSKSPAQPFLRPGLLAAARRFGGR